MWSLKNELKANVTGPKASLVSDVFGYIRGRLPRDPDGGPTSISLRKWAQLRVGNSFNVMTIFVGIESFTPSMFDEIDNRHTPDAGGLRRNRSGREMDCAMADHDLR